MGLLSEARAVGILPSESVDEISVVERLRRALTWKPTPVPEDDGQRVTTIENELLALRAASGDPKTD
jgi:hypothetical protein